MTKLGFLRLSYEKQDTLLKLLILSMAAVLCEWMRVALYQTFLTLWQLSSNSVCLIFFQRSLPDCFLCCGLRASSMSLIRKYSFRIVILETSKHLINWVFCLFNDRYFNYRTTRFLAEEGFYKFHNWFDDRAWYPLGRIIGGTIYPGTAEGHSFQEKFICVFQPLADSLWSWAKYQIPEYFSHGATISLHLMKCCPGKYYLQ